MPLADRLQALDLRESEAAFLYMALTTAIKDDPTQTYFLRVLREWSQAVPSLPIALVLSGPASRGQRGMVEDFLKSRVTVWWDPDSSLRDACLLEPAPGGGGFLLSQTGKVLLRAQPIRVEGAHSILAHLEQFAQNGAIPSSSHPFSMLHPDSVTASPAELITDHPVYGQFHPAPSRQDKPFLVYAFAPDCSPCTLASEVTADLADEFRDTVSVIVLARFLSPKGIESAKDHGARYGEYLPAERVEWIRTLPSTPQEVANYVQDCVAFAEEYAGSTDSALHMLVDWDSALAGALGMGMAGFPSWALLHADGRLVEVLAGKTETVYDNGEPVMATIPSIDDLRQRIGHLLDAEYD